ncbi:uncharacterized protein LOC108109625 [Drosophila eugracilis]|uniref:uncharacterized protein LOC108109625 n=1 Tax=Drosophila eugracilis TaxID=29029 RepID=UPI001BDA5585|nr:uncharacterized protein LOC108109625 [Drosophila eugracilis]
MSRNVTLSDEQSRLNARLEAHMVYICPECGKAFRTQAEWRQHLNTKHDYLKKTYSDFNFIQIDERFHECQLCFKWVENAHKTIALLQYHYFMHLEHSETYRCVHCRMAYTRRRALNVHLLDTHMREIEKYENKLRQMKRQQQSKPTMVTPSVAQKPVPVRPRGRPRKVDKQKNDLLQKALMDIDLNTELEKSPTLPATPVAAASSNSSKINTNISEQNLDRCLNAYEDIVRKEEEKVLRYDAELDALCKEFFEDANAISKGKAAEEQHIPDAALQQEKEVVIIEIDALGKEEVAQLKMDMKSDTISQPAKRRRLSPTPTQDSDSDSSTNGLTKLITYLCPKCGKEIASMDEWRTHVFKKHDFEHIIENSFKIIEPGRKAMCLQCREVQPTINRSQLQKHCFKHLPYRSYLKCTLCDRTKTSTSKILNHIRYNHQEELQRKNKTQLLIKPEPKWASPNKSGQAGIPDDTGSNDDDDECIVCEHCNKIFKSKWRRDRHSVACRRGGVIEGSVEAMLNNLREGHMRMNVIWKAMQIEKD